MPSLSCAVRTGVPGLVLVFLLTVSCGGDSGGVGGGRAEPRSRVSRYTAVYADVPAAVLEAIFAEMIALGARTEDEAVELRNVAAARIAADRIARITARSADVAPEVLRSYVVEAQQRWVIDGGRFALYVDVEELQGIGTRVNVAATLVATVPGAEGPLGGRPVRSSGSLERALLDALNQRLTVVD